MFALRASRVRFRGVNSSIPRFQSRTQNSASSSPIKWDTVNLNPGANVFKLAKPVPKAVGYWLLGMSGLVAGMVSIGGITRLTKSGLSMTDWKLQGTLPPMNIEEWNREFDRYKQYPEWQQRQNMTLDEFKYIFYWEWGHRMMGRSLGFAFAVPFLVFAARGMIPSSLMPRMALLFGMGGTQGLIGWWMVKSGLDKATIIGLDQNREIRVSPYRLATHLGMAFLTFGACLWTGLEIVKPTEETIRNLMKKSNMISKDVLANAKYIRRFSLFNVVLVATTVMSGAYVAGNDAGNAYNTFPKMGDEWIPEGMYSLEPKWRNVFENTATVQFDHRILALSTLGSIATMFVLARKGSNGQLWKHILPAHTKKWLHSVVGMAGVQVGLGISTLLLYVPIPLAATHQLGSLALLTFSTGALHSLRFANVLKTVAK
jgi:heme a synthase